MDKNNRSRRLNNLDKTNDGKEIPQWDIFERVEDLERLTDHLLSSREDLTPTLNDLRDHLGDIEAIALTSFVCEFTRVVVAAPRRATQERDLRLQTLKLLNARQETITRLERLMNEVCCMVPTKRTSF
jgi:hypothetical protein